MKDEGSMHRAWLNTFILHPSCFILILASKSFNSHVVTHSSLLPRGCGGEGARSGEWGLACGAQSTGQPRALPDCWMAECACVQLDLAASWAALRVASGRLDQFHAGRICLED